MSKRRLRVIGLGAICLLIAAGCAKKESQNGSSADKQVQRTAAVQAPLFTLKNYDGKEISLSDYKGKIVVLEWFNYDCPFSRYNYQTARSMEKLAEKYAERGVVFLAIDSTASALPEKNKDAAEAEKLNYPILDDRSGEVGRAYKAKTTPHMFIIDRDGKLVYRGAIDNAPLGKSADGTVYYVDQALSELLVGKEVSVPETEPYGCSVKYAN